MSKAPGRLIVAGYAAALVPALGWLDVIGATGAALAVWLGGPVAVLALAAHSSSRRWLAPVSEDKDTADAALAEELRRWSEDRLADAATPETAPREAKAS